MAGLMLLGALVLFVSLLIWISGLLTRRLPTSNGWRSMLRVLIVVGAFPLMIGDEIIGKSQLDVLCRENGIESADLSKANGKRVKVYYEDRRFVPGMLIPIKESEIRFADTETNVILIQYKNYYANGGWLMRFTPLGMGAQSPMTFSGGCNELTERKHAFSKHNIYQTN